VSAPSWAAIPGISQFIDDSLGYWSNSTPYLEGFYVVYGMVTTGGVGEAVLIDHITASRQLTP